jgi:membrane protein implicated in regulation of membrane protease activity
MQSDDVAAYRFGARGIELDRTRGLVTTWRRALLRTSQTRELASFWTVLLGMGRRQTRFAARTVYVVGLHGEVGEPLLLHWHEDYLSARQFAEEVAGFLHFPFTDASGAQTIVHNASRPSVPLGETAVPDVPLPRKPMPAGMRCRASWRERTFVMEEARAGWKRLIGLPLALFLLLAVPCLGAGTYAHFFGTNSPVFTGPLTASIITVATLFVLFATLIVSSLPQLGRRRVVEASPVGLCFKLVGPIATGERHIRAADISELRIALGHLCAITPRDYRVVCGRIDQPLARAELEWLREQLTQALKG